MREIRRKLAEGERGAVLAREFGVSQAAISYIRLGRVRRDEFDPDHVVSHHGINTPKLADEQVREIRRRLTGGEIGSALAREFGVAPTTISQIRTGHTWAHVI